MERRVGGTVAFDVPAAVAFDYLADPRNRPQWQRSLRRVSHVVGEVGVGQTWVDETRVGIKPRMRTTHFERPTQWSESGSWQFVRADLALEFEPAQGGAASDVGYSFRIHALGPLGLVASAVAVLAVRADLSRAARILAAR